MCQAQILMCFRDILVGGPVYLIIIAIPSSLISSPPFHNISSPFSLSYFTTALKQIALADNSKNEMLIQVT